MSPRVGAANGHALAGRAFGAATRPAPAGPFANPGGSRPRLAGRASRRTASEPGRSTPAGSTEARTLRSLWAYLPSDGLGGSGFTVPGVTPNTYPNGPEADLDPNQCLTFFLTGGTLTNFQGFSTNKAAPFAAGGDRIGPFLDLPQN